MLVVEMVFYFVILPVRKINFKNTLVINAVVLLLLFFQINTKNLAFHSLNYFLQFVPLMLLGSMIALYRSKNMFSFLPCFLQGCIAYFTLYLSHVYLYKDDHYLTPFTYLLALIIWISIYLLDKISFKIPTGWGVLKKIKEFMVNTSYVIYLLHVPICFTIMYYMRDIVPPVVNVLLSLLCVYVLAGGIYYFLEKPILNYCSRKFLKKR